MTIAVEVTPSEHDSVVVAVSVMVTDEAVTSVQGASLDSGGVPITTTSLYVPQLGCALQNASWLNGNASLLRLTPSYLMFGAALARARMPAAARIDWRIVIKLSRNLFTEQLTRNTLMTRGTTLLYILPPTGNLASSANANCAAAVRCPILIAPPSD